MSLTCVGESPQHGTVLLASRDIVAGECVLTEPPITVVDLATEGDAASSYARYSGLPVKLWSQFFHFVQQDVATQEAILTLFSPVDGPTACQTREAVTRFLEGFSPRNKTVGAGTAGDIDAELFVKVNMVYHFNAVTVLQGSGGSALFALACRLTHACRPNCAWRWDEKGCRVVSALCSVAAGSRLSVDYLGGGQMESKEGREKRRQVLRAHYEFTCDCASCTEDGLLFIYNHSPRVQHP